MLIYFTRLKYFSCFFSPGTSEDVVKCVTFKNNKHLHNIKVCPCFSVYSLFFKPFASFNQFLSAHLSQGLKWAFLIKKSSVVCYRLYTFHIFIFFFKITGPILNKLGMKQKLMKGMEVFQIKGHTLFEEEVPYIMDIAKFVKNGGNVLHYYFAIQKVSYRLLYQI